jgi:ADP-heptose:LPS heptosyltransferase
LALYQFDAVCSKTASSPANLLSDYDLIILHSASSRSIQTKFAHYRNTPFVHLHGYYNGPEFNRTLFGYYRLNQLLGLNLSQAHIQKIACPSMQASTEDQHTIDALNLPESIICLCIGGVKTERIYEHWLEVLNQLSTANFNYTVVLLGSENGLAMRDQIIASSPLPIIDRVAKNTLGAVQVLMQRSHLVVCADGGLMHLAHSTQTAVIGLFAHLFEPRFRITSANQTHCLHSKGSVSDIQPKEVVQAVLNRLQQ